MITKAINKLKAEMDKENKDAYVKVIGDFMLQHLNKYPEAAENILAEGKTIAKSIDEMAKVAKKKAVNGRAMLTDQEGFEIVLKYFGIEALVDSGDIAVNNELKSPVLKEKEESKGKDVDFDIKLEDFLV